MAAMERRRFRVRGIVQGVGFRPFVYGLALRHGLAGFVLNDGDGVVIEAEGSARRSRRVRGRARAPRRRRSRASTASTERPLASVGETRVRDRARARAAAAARSIPADVATCDDCLRELFDPADRRYRYPFINCTQCGPRFTIVTRRPVRPAEHDDGRRSRCAPSAGASTRIRSTAASTPSRSRVPPAGRSCRCRSRRRSRCSAAARSSRSRASAATTSPATPRTRRPVARLRARKHREDKPFALMTTEPELLAEVGRASRAARSRARGRSCSSRRRAGCAGRAVGRPGTPVGRRDAPVHAAPPPAAAPTSAARS